MSEKYTDKQLLLSFLLNYVSQKDNFVFLWNDRVDEHNHNSFLFTNPSDIIVCYKADKLNEAFDLLERSIESNKYLAGFISFEAGFCFEEIAEKELENFPLLWFGVYESPIIFDHKEAVFSHSVDLQNDLKSFTNCDDQSYIIKDIESNIKKDEYTGDINYIREAISNGETYQVNYTFKMKFQFEGSTEKLFYDLCTKQSVSYSAFIRFGGWDILSISPELFFRKDKDKLIVKPMKGTIKRGVNNIDDINKSYELYNSAKNRAENVMIVDLLRNDIGKISRISSVKVNKLYEIEKYETLFQMTSTIESQLKHDINWTNLIKSIFPSGSVTGAPKINTMRIIDKLEKEPRGVYTGSIGYIAPYNCGVFNVAIRTVVINKDKKCGEMGVGSGIVYDSDAETEFEECLLKANFLTSKHIDFQLIETILLQDGKYYLLDLHLKRLKESSEYFGFRYDEEEIIKALGNNCSKEKYRVRLLLDRNGKITITKSKLDDISSEPKNVTFSDIRIDPNNIFFYHKTTNRTIYDQELRKAREKGYFDILFINNRDEVTEGAISNVVIKDKDVYYTPPIESGLLNGVFRQYLFESNFPIAEKLLKKEDLLNAEKIYLINSVRGMIEVILDVGSFK